MPFDPSQLPADLPVPVDDGAAAHLPGTAMPPIALPSTSGAPVRVDEVPAGFGRLVLYAYPMTGLPGVPVPDGWDEIPGARGCTPETCGFRDHAAELAALGATVAGLSTQSTGYQQEAADRLHLTLLKRITLVVNGGLIEKVFYPIFPPDRHAEEVLTWMGAQA
jgi:peroxiredoxin